MTIDYEKLRVLAKGATPGPWRDGHYDGHHVLVPDGCARNSSGYLDYGGGIMCHDIREQDAQFIAAANPETVLSLLDERATTCGDVDIARYERDNAERERDQLRAEVERLDKELGPKAAANMSKYIGRLEAQLTAEQLEAACALEKKQ